MLVSRTVTKSCDHRFVARPCKIASQALFKLFYNKDADRNCGTERSL